METKTLSPISSESTALFSLQPEDVKKFLGAAISKPAYSEREVFDKVMAEGTAYLFYDWLQLHPETLGPDSWLYQKLEESYFHNLTDNQNWKQQFLDEYSALAGGTRTLLLKGISLLGTVYEDPGLRHLGDIDILIHREDYPALSRRLKSAGYAFSQDMADFTSSESFNSIMCQKNNPAPREPVIHLHWHLINTTAPVYLCAPRFNLERIWRDAAPVDYYPGLYLLSPEDQIIFYAYHHLKHSCEKLIRLHDIDRTLRFYENFLSWEKILEEAHTSNMERHLYFPLVMARTLLESPIPDFVIEKLTPHPFTQLERRLLDAFLRGEKPTHGHYVIYFSMQKNVGQKARFLFRSFFPRMEIRRHQTLSHLLRRFLNGLQRGFSLIRILFGKK